MFSELLDAIDAPRRGLFQLAGSDDGSGAGLLASLGVDRESALGRYGGLAAELLGDPLNLVGVGGVAKVGRGVNKLQEALRAGDVADAGLDVANATADLGAARRLEQAALDAEGTFNPATFGPGDLPVPELFPAGQRFDRAPDLRWEQVGSANSRQSRSLGSNRVPDELLNRQAEGIDGPLGDQIDFVQARHNTLLNPETALYGAANNLRTKTMYDLKREFGAMYPTDRGEAGDLISDALAGQGRYNAGQNAALRASELAELESRGGHPMLSVGHMLGGQVDDVVAATGRSPTFAAALRSAGPEMDATKLRTTGLLPGMETELKAAQQRLAMLQAIDPTLGQYATAAAGGALGGLAGTRVLTSDRRRQGG